MGRAWTPRAEEREGEEERVGEGEMRTALEVLIPVGAEQAASRRWRGTAAASFWPEGRRRKEKDLYRKPPGLICKY